VIAGTLVLDRNELQFSSTPDSALIGEMSGILPFCIQSKEANTFREITKKVRVDPKLAVFVVMEQQLLMHFMKHRNFDCTAKPRKDFMSVWSDEHIDQVTSLREKPVFCTEDGEPINCHAMEAFLRCFGS
jgi:hypothetical protein